MDKWLIAVWLIVNCKNGISSYGLARDIRVHKASAWFMLQRIRKAMQRGSFNKMSGEVEADESLIGDKARNMRPDRKAKSLLAEPEKKSSWVCLNARLARSREARGQPARA